MNAIHLIDDKFDACLPIPETLPLLGRQRWWQPLLTILLVLAHALTLAHPAQAAATIKHRTRQQPDLRWAALPDTPAALLPDEHRYGAQGKWGYHPWDVPQPPEGNPAPTPKTDSLSGAPESIQTAVSQKSSPTPRSPQSIPYTFNSTTGALTVTMPMTMTNLTIGCDLTGQVDFNNGNTILVNCNAVTSLYVQGNTASNQIDASAATASTYPQLQAATLMGAAGNDILDAPESNTALWGGDGNDQLNGNLGNDSLFGEAGDDTLFGTTGNDYLDGGLNADGYISAGPGDDTIVSALAEDLFSDTGGNDWLIEPDLDVNLTLSDSNIGDFEIVRITAGPSPNLIDASDYSKGSLYIDGLAGNDTLIGGSGSNILLGGDDNDSLIGGAGSDSLDGGLGYDTLIGNGGDDWLNGGSQDDILSGGEGSDVLLGGAGIDALTESGLYTFTLSSVALVQTIPLSPTIVVTDQLSTIESARITGTLGAEIMDASAFTGTVTLNGTAGSDTLYGGSGDDVLLASAYTPGDSNWLQGNGGADFLIGTDGNDILLGDAPANSALGGNDTLSGGLGDDTLVGHAGNDFMAGEGGNDLMYGSNDNDTLLGGSENDLLWGGFGDDSLLGEAGMDTLNGEDGNDLLYGGTEDDSLLGSVGNDALTGDAGNDRLYGEDGNDSLYGSDGDDLLYGGAGDDFMQSTSGLNIFQGEAGNDTLLGGLNEDSLYGGDGSDSLLGGAANDLLYGENGGDWLDGGNDNDQVYGDDQVGTLLFPGPDTLTGGPGNDEVYGSDGNDLLFSQSAGTNTFHGGKGSDIYQLTASGGISDNTIQENLNEGSDTAAFTATAGNNQIGLEGVQERLTLGSETVHFDANLESLTILSGDGDDEVTVAPSQFVTFHVDGGPHTAGDTLIYDRTGLSNAQDDGAGTITADGRQPVMYQNVENVSLTENLKKIFLPLILRNH
ncbi:MAG: hypothetical protein Fur0018_18330 [Anaerolineales bacterium]